MNKDICINICEENQFLVREREVIVINNKHPVETLNVHNFFDFCSTVRLIIQHFREKQPFESCELKNSKFLAVDDTIQWISGEWTIILSKKNFSDFINAAVLAIFTSLYLSNDEDRLVVCVLQELEKLSERKLEKIFQQFASETGTLRLECWSQSQDFLDECFKKHQVSYANNPYYRSLLLTLFPAMLALLMLRKDAKSPLSELKNWHAAVA
jgi:hypothetical protein